jgi:hypothetical protein
MRRLLAIGFVWLCCAIAWAILGSTLSVRSDASYDGLSEAVTGLWGPPLAQAPPSAVGSETHAVAKAESRYDEKRHRLEQVEWTEPVTTTRDMALASSDVDVKLALEHRRKGLLWFPTYGVEFGGRYTFRNGTPEAREVDLTFPIERGVTYDGFAVRVPGGKPLETSFAEGGAVFHARLAPGESRSFTVAYKARGTRGWGYGAPGKGLGPEPGRATSFSLAMHTDFPQVDFPAGSLSPTAHRVEGSGWSGTWRFDQLVSTATIGLDLPQKLNPGPLASRITFFAPLSLLFFFFVTGIVLAARQRSIHPMNYFLLGCAFFAFHLLFAYLIDHLEVGPSFAIASLVSIGLVVSYARLFVGWRTALLTFGTSQLVYLVLFSFTFFWPGFTGLAITIGAVLTLFVMMQLTGRLDWSEVFSRPPSSAREPLPARPA